MSEPNIKISVIIPVYNVENYLHECIDSVLNQNYSNLEVLLINDGSTDTSGQICNSYSARDQRIKVLHQENKGAAAARNLGLKYTSGDYVCFIDSDDFIGQGLYLEIIDYLEKSKDTIDVFYIPFTDRKHNISKTIYSKSEIRSQFIHQFIGTAKMAIAKMGSVCALCIRREIIKDLTFCEITVIEDKPFFIETLIRATNLVILTNKYYTYRVNTTSLIRSYNKEFMKSSTFANKVIKEILKKYDADTQSLIYLNDNTTVIFYYHLIKNEIKNNDINCDPIQIRNNIKQYYTDNNIKKLLTWERTIRASLRNPKWLLIKLGYTDIVINMLWNKKMKKLRKPNLQYSPQS
ncbi:glycosyltransferase involved in cell wall biosynthesis [Dysgonomonas alginatilytica]|uniref:Glycosyltransferase involved in cell wall biosynthesis n=1 Tax=Dysgonomonas alginatilytica TaxID=1605892 RepID=A0A2V3PVM2_9BACT|nr:glycosyltransferase family 2 protein [Dysgonomonas alginatilytica]PXV68871.1 glycosyltransferase involved in cell wall biosynthesis [Dysgonomonas alginatilytica]